ncbi:hypothetical protein [Azotobacter chroococcum]|uniref:hypothetical protein n=1 Tax=Azotobacter chroococcum TaxID=353 RepID=UPI001E436379|nr:hypothetical protein [Azotobacter chroococcum]
MIDPDATRHHHPGAAAPVPMTGGFSVRLNPAGKATRKRNKLVKKIERTWLAFRYFLRNRFSSDPVCAPGGVTVSLTSHSTRTERVYLAIESIAAGLEKPGRLILWLDDAGIFAKLPASLQRLQKRGLEIRLCRNYGPHTKYYPFLEHEEIEGVLVTADDDSFYPPTWLKRLHESHRATPETVVAYKALCVRITDGRIEPYLNWRFCLEEEASFRNFALGVGGVIYPADFLRRLKAAGTAFTACCPRHDDVWLHATAVRQGYRVRQISNDVNHFPLVPGTQRIGLKNVNKIGGNDLAISQTYRTADILKMQGGDAPARA